MECKGFARDVGKVHSIENNFQRGRHVITASAKETTVLFASKECLRSCRTQSVLDLSGLLFD